MFWTLFLSCLSTFCCIFFNITFAFKGSMSKYTHTHTHKTVMDLWSALVQIMVCCITAPSDYQHQCWLLSSRLLRQPVNTLRPRQNGRHFADDIFKCIFLNENIWISIKISMKFVPKGPINNIPALVQIMAWRRPGDKPLSEAMMVILTTHICVTQPQWVKCVELGMLMKVITTRHLEIIHLE